jgi:hypothetical protein
MTDHTIKLVVDEGVPARIADTLMKALPDWQVCFANEPIPLDEDGGIPMVDLARRYRSDQGSDVVVMITELPLRVRTTPLVADYNMKAQVALFSLPAFGVMRVRQRLCGVAVPLIAHLSGRDATFPGRMGALRIPVRRISADAPGGNQHLALTGIRGRLQMLAGMVFANRPWRLVPSLQSATAAAAAAAGLTIFYSSIWQMAMILHPWRLASISALAIAAMVVWFVCYNSLWDRPSSGRARAETVLFNASTVLTLAIGVSVMYAVLCVGIMVAVVSVVDGRYLQSQVGHPAGVRDYAQIVWLSSSIGIIAGALGSSFDGEDAVLHAAYSRRERERRQREEQQDDETDQMT